MSTKIKLNGDWVDVANNSVSDSVRNPDWSRAVGISDAQILAGWTAPEDGIIVMPYVIPNSGASVQASVSINGIDIIKPYYGATSSDQRPLSMQCPVATGDILKSNVSVTVTGQLSKFVPYRIQKSTEESHAIIQITNEIVNNSTVLPKGDETATIEVAKFILPTKGVYFICGQITAPHTANTGIVVTSQDASVWCVSPASNSTATFVLTFAAPSDNFTFHINAKTVGTVAGTVTSHATNGQAIKLY